MSEHPMIVFIGQITACLTRNEQQEASQRQPPLLSIMSQSAQHTQMTTSGHIQTPKPGILRPFIIKPLFPPTTG